MWSQSIARAAFAETPPATAVRWAGVGRLAEMLVAGIAVAQVEAALDAGRHEIDASCEAAGNAAQHVVAQMAGHDAFEQRELDRGLPLDRQPVRRDRGQDPLQLPPHRPAVGLLEQGARGRHDIDARDRERRRQADLEAHAGRG